MIGSKALSWSCPASAAMVMVTSLPMTSKATWLTTSGITGLTLPGMMLEPACTGGRLISLRPARGPGGRRPQVVAALRQLHRDPLEHAGHLDEGAAVLGGLDQVGGGDQGDPGDRGEVAAGGFRVSGGGVAAGTDGRGAEVDLVDQLDGLGETAAVLVEHHRVRRELLPEGHRHRVLELGTPIFNTSRNSKALAAKASWSTAIALSSSRTAKTVATLTAVG